NIPEFTSNLVEVCEGWNALQFAMEINNTEAIKCLLKKSKSAYRDISIKNSKGFNVLGQMIYDNQIETLEWILEHIPEFEYGIVKKAPASKYIPIKNNKGFNFLGQIIFNNHLEILKWVLDNIPELKNEIVEVCDGWNAFQFAMNLNNFEAAKHLLEKTFVYRSITIKDIFGFNILCHVIQFNNLEMLQWILDNIPEFINNTTVVSGEWNALQFAMDINNPDADNTTIKNSSGLNILGYVIYNNELDLLEWILDNIPKFITEIIEVCENQNALEFAMNINNPVVIKYLLKKAQVYQDAKIKNNLEQNVLGHVIYHNQVELLEWILINISEFKNSVVEVCKNYNALQFAMHQLNIAAIKCILYNSYNYRDTSIRYKELNILGYIIYHNLLEALQWILENIPEFRDEI
ncbi:20004_t:CDS:2, partial [Racocetra persica]